MCGWPVGVAFPAHNGELDAHAAAEATAADEVAQAEAAQADANEQQAAAQLDALSTMMERQTSPEAAADSSVAVVADADEQVDTQAEPELVMAGVVEAPAEAGAQVVAEPPSAPIAEAEPPTGGRRRAGPPSDEPVSVEDQPVEAEVDAPVAAVDTVPTPSEQEDEATVAKSSTSDRQLALVALLVAVLALVVAGASFVL